MNKKKKLEDELSKKKLEIKELNNKLSHRKEKSEIRISDIVKKIIKDKDVIKKIDNEFSDSKELSKAIDKVVEAKDGFTEVLNETKGLTNHIRAVCRVLSRSSKITIFAIALILIFLSIEVPFYKANVNYFIKRLAIAITWLTTLLAPIVGWFKSRTLICARKKVNDWCNYLEELSKKQKDDIKKIEKELDSEIEHIKKDISEAVKNSVKFDNNIKSIENEIKDIDSNYMEYFIKKRIDSNDYTKHLGIINLIRKDFEVLSKYLRDSKSNNDRNIDRIVLYIDDLDRCPPENVVQVLQAIHLILSFELFVVIVAVDVRWVSNCLCQCYKTMFRESNVKAGTSSYDYLEKIFQLPIKLQAVSCENSKMYISSLLRENHNNKNIEVAYMQQSLKETLAEVTDLQSMESSFTQDDDFLGMKSDVEIMQISEDDIRYIEEFIPILGNTPRTIKRFVNIFRLIKANNQLVVNNRREALFLLSITTGLPNISLKLLKIISNSQKTDYKSLVLDLEKSLGENVIEEIEMKRLCEFMEDSSRKTLIMDKYRILIPIVSRYSFYLGDLI